MDKNNVSSGGAKLSLHSISSLFSDTWKLYKERWSVLVEIVLLPVLVAVLGYILIGLGFPFSLVGGLILFVGWIILIFSVLPVIFSIHNTTGVDASYKATIGLFWPFVWITIVEMLAVIGGFFMAIIPGIWLSIALSLMAYVFVIERRRGIDALRQSKDYIKGYWWALVGRIILLSMIFGIATVIIEIPVQIVAGNAARIIVTLVLTLFFIPFSAIYHYHIFENLRELKPELADATRKKGGGFITASAIVGIVVPALIVLAAIVLLGVGIFHGIRSMDRYAPPPGYPAQSTW